MVPFLFPGIKEMFPKTWSVANWLAGIELSSSGFRHQTKAKPAQRHPLFLILRRSIVQMKMFTP
jgi:hypothetical protein